MIRLIIADDDPIVLHGLKMIISTQNDIDLLGTTSNGKEAVDICRKTKVDVVLLDVKMPIMDGIIAAEIIIKEELGKPLLLTTFDDEELIWKAIKLGTYGYILKNSPAERILLAISTVHKGGVVFSPDILGYMQSIKPSISNNSFFDILTPREKEIVVLISKGLTNSQIAESLFISNGTVRNHISMILEKTNLEHRTQIAIKYYT